MGMQWETYEVRSAKMTKRGGQREKRGQPRGHLGRDLTALQTHAWILRHTMRYSGEGVGNAHQLFRGVEIRQHIRKVRAEEELRDGCYTLTSC